MQTRSASWRIPESSRVDVGAECDEATTVLRAQAVDLSARVAARDRRRERKRMGA
jgi:hypothetical protein